MSAPKGAKQPQDRLAKAEATGQNITVDYNGTAYILDADVFDDVEIMELIGDMQEDVTLLPKTVRSILGVEQWAKFKDGNRGDNGRVSVERLHEFFTAMDAAAGNSAASPGS